MKFELRPYQQEAVDAIYSHFEASADNALVVIPTAGGKTPVLTSFLSGAIGQWPETRVLCLVHVKELLEQAFSTLIRLWQNAPASIYSAGLNSRNLNGQIVFATIQSIFKKAYQLQNIDLVIIDEVDLVPHGDEGMYRKLLADLKSINPYIKVLGLTATPWRLSSGLITEGDNPLFKSICYEVEIGTLLKGGYICPPIAKTMETQINVSGVKVRGGEFIASALEEAADKAEITEAAVDEIIELGRNRHSWLAFCAGVDHALHVRDSFKTRGITCEAITGKTPASERALFIREYKAGRIKCLTNCGVLTVGFDSPATDLLAILRPTKSSRLWLQILGRGFRLSPGTGKKNFLVLDYTSNSKNFGPIDLLRPKSKSKSKKSDEPAEAPSKVCPECEAEMLIASKECLACGYVFPPSAAQITHTASDAPLLASQIKPVWLDVSAVTYQRHEKAGKPPSMRVLYRCGMIFHQTWWCPEHTGFARQKFVQTWIRHAPGSTIPKTVEEALSQTEMLAKPKSICVRASGKYTEIVSARFE